jgi:translation initiation factor eIF-2B subunit delta
LRCLAILRALIKFVKDYQGAGNARIEVDFVKRIKHIQEFLRRCKPFTSGIEFAFEHVIESFNKLIQEINEEVEEKKLSDAEKLELVKEGMVDIIYTFANMRIVNANKAICEEAVKQIKDGETILTYGANYTVKSVFLHALKQNIQFSVIVVGFDKNDRESIDLALFLTDHGVECLYLMASNLGAHKVSKVFLGGISMMNNGYLVAKAGTASIACWAKSKMHDTTTSKDLLLKMVPVVVCIESFKFSKKAVVHSLVTTEIIDGEEEKNKLNNKYDITPSKFIDMVVCEMG